MSTQLTQAINKNFLLKTKIMMAVFGLIFIFQIISASIVFINGIATVDLLYRAIYIPIFLILIVVDQYFLLLYIKKRIRENKEIKHFLIYIASFFESSFPTIVLAYGTILSGSIKEVDEITILNSPPEYLYFIFIVLSALLMEAKLTITIGIICGVEYFFLVYYFSGPITEIEFIIYLIKPVIMILFSVVTGLITRTIRASVISSLEAQRILIEELDSKVKERTKEISFQKEIIEEKNKEIVDSINYAQRIQYTLLANEELLNKNIPGHFVIFQPKDIVSGDFYWGTEEVGSGNRQFYLAVCDCTGHGVPGAFMSLLNISFLNEAIVERKIEHVDEVLNFVRDQLIKNMEGARDGMDATLIKFQMTNDKCKIEYAAANNAPLLIRGGKLIELKADKMPVGKGEKNEPFTLYNEELQKGDYLFMLTDGYADQFGGPKGKKLKLSTLKKLLELNHQKSPAELKIILTNEFEKWKGELEQVDDVCIIGIKI